ncbi:hypothetical protein [Nocardia sp. SC052]
MTASQGTHYRTPQSNLPAPVECMYSITALFVDGAIEDGSDAEFGSTG